SQRYDSSAPCIEERIGADEQCISMLLDERPKRRFQLPIVSRHGDFDPPIDGACRILDLSRLGFGSLIVWIYQHTNNGCIGPSSCSNPSRFASGTVVKRLTPVALPPGRLRLATKPILTGSPPTVNTIGIVEVAALAASAEGSPPVVARTATPCRTRSAASAGRRSYWPSAHRYSIDTFLPST